MPQLTIALAVVPIPKQITNPFCAFPLRARGKCAITFVIGVRLVIPTPLTNSLLFMLLPPATTVVT